MLSKYYAAGVLKAIGHDNDLSGEDRDVLERIANTICLLSPSEWDAADNAVEAAERGRYRTMKEGSENG